MLLGLAHDRLVRSGTFYIERGWISPDEYENIYDFIFIPYKELGGNGAAERIVENVKKLPFKPPSA